MAYWRGSQYDRQQRVAQASQNVDQVHAGPFLYLTSRQFGTAIADFNIGNWTTQVGGTTNLFAVVDETTPDDSDYIRSEVAPVTSAVTLSLTALSTPNDGPQYVRYRYGKDVAGQPTDLTVELLEGAAIVQTWTHTDIPVGFLLATQQITNAISNYGALQIRFTANGPV